ncbi:MAG: hypothetical protein KUG67_03220, partial [Proteobacteria bacterium]|nr:hypothetical protein [Pseudomonadota bacterium]
MATVYPTYFNRVKYTLQHKYSGSQRIKEPIGWDEDEKEFARIKNKNLSGVITKFSNNLEFVGEGADYISLTREIYGINAEIRLTKEIRNATTDVWELSYSGILDLSTYEKKGRKVKAKYNASGLEQTLKARLSEKIEVERDDTLRGRTVVDPLIQRSLYLEGRRIFLESAMEVDNVNNEADVAVESNAGNTRDQTCGIPLKIKQNSHQGLLNTVTPQTNASKDVGDLDMMFIFDSDRDRTFNFDIAGKLDAFVQQHENIEWAYYRICITKYENGFDFNLKERIVLTNLSDIEPLFGIDYDDDISPYTVPNVPFSYQNSVFEVLEGESVALEVILEADMYFNNNAGCRVFAQNISLDYDFILNEDSVFPSSWSKVVLAHDIVKKVVSVITDKQDSFRSFALGTQALGYLEDGVAAFTGFAHGFWIRGFDKFPLSQPATDTEPAIENKYKGLTTSLKDLVQFFSVTWGLALGIERIGFKERVILEDRKYFFVPNTTIKLPFQVQNIKRKVAKEEYFSSIEVGYQKGGEYEEAVGLDEYNAQSTFTTVITRIIKVLKIISKIRVDMYGAEFARRKPESDFKTEDTSYDKDVFGFDMKPKGAPDEYEMRKWQDDFSQEPTGVYNPATATNLRWTPFNVMFYKHGWEIASSFITYASDFVRYGSSTANSGLKTKFFGGDEYAENGNVQNSKFEKARFVPEWIEFEHVVDHELMRTVEGTSVILGK